MQQYEPLSAAILQNCSTQISTDLAAWHQANPLILPQGMYNPEETIQLIEKHIRLHEAIMLAGDKDHTNDWDPTVEITLYNGAVIGGEAGYSDIEILPETNPGPPHRELKLWVSETYVYSDPDDEEEETDYLIICITGLVYGIAKIQYRY